MLAAAAEDEDRRRTTSAPATPAERAAAAQLVAAEEFRGTFVCRACALDVVGRMVQVAVEAAEHDLRERMKEQMQCPN
jgi:hypothetical protein